MAISNIKEIPASLFDQLLALNDLVQTIRDTDNLNEIVKTLQDERDATKKQYDDLTTLKVANDLTAKQLKDATDANNQSIADLEQAKNDAANAQANADASIQKSQTLIKQLTQVQNDYAAQVQSKEADLSQRMSDVTARESAAAQTQTQANNMKSEYETKLDALKSITG